MKRPLWIVSSLIPVVAAICVLWPLATRSQVPAGWSTKMPCSYCHNLHGTGSLVVRGEANIEALCQSCHAADYVDPNDPTKVAAQVKPHSRLSGSATYGTWKISCVGCHNPHKYLKNKLTDDATGQWGNIFLIGKIVLDADTTRDAIPSDGVARIARPFINDNGTAADPSDDVMEGYWCGLKPGTNTVNPCADEGPAATDGVRKVVFWKDTVNTANLAADPWESHWAQGEKTGSGSKDFGDITEPPNSWGDRWYDGACNVCHTRTKYHRRGNSGGTRAMGMDKTAGCAACHDHDANKGGWIQ